VSGKTDTSKDTERSRLRRRLSTRSNTAIVDAIVELINVVMCRRQKIEREGRARTTKTKASFLYAVGGAIIVGAWVWAIAD
jgi:hypothetical protein